MRKFSALMVLTLAGCGIPASVATTPVGPIPLQQVYYATFEKGSMGCCFADYIHNFPEPVDASESKVYGQNSTWAYRNSNLVLKVTAPYTPPYLNATVSTGISLSDLYFGGPGYIFSVRATFQNPSGPDDNNTAWATAIAARTGNDVDADEGQKRLIVTLKHKRDANGVATVTFNVYGFASADPANDTLNTTISPFNPIYDWIYEQKKPYALELYVNRKSGLSWATLTAGTYPPVRLAFTPQDFTPASPLKVTTVGAWLAIAQGPTRSASVEVNDFQISALPKPCLACARPG